MMDKEMLPHPRILEILEDMKAKGMLSEKNREIAREVLAENAPDRVRPAPYNLSEVLIQELMEDRGFTREEAEEAVKEVE